LLPEIFFNVHPQFFAGHSDELFQIVELELRLGAVGVGPASGFVPALRGHGQAQGLPYDGNNHQPTTINQ
jgi:hypothetical protein